MIIALVICLMGMSFYWGFLCGLWREKKALDIAKQCLDEWEKERNQYLKV